MQTTPNLGLVVPSIDGDPFDWAPFSNAFVRLDGLVMARIADVVVPVGGASAIDFGATTPIPQTFSHLLLLVEPRHAGAGVAIDTYIRLNNDAAGNYHYVGHVANGGTGLALLTGTTQGSIATGWIPGNGSFTNTYGSHLIVIPNYAAAGNKKTLLVFSGNGGSNTAADLRAAMLLGGYNVVGAVTRITYFPSSGNLDVSTRATLYGLP